VEIKEDLISIMCCPKCKGAVKLSETGDAVICKPCGLEYPVRAGIPVMLVSEASKAGGE
jgi:uncharacterized protein YbaR (Trm112 family)